ncbi:hypothetical protein [Streptomyces sp. NPDC053720]|uniref:hypothetical protein n=1 Tax=Streptomyces sp. NPDC053720 TaxID=3154855 RepID=UPI0034415BC4
MSSGVVVPDRGGQRVDALHDAGYDTSGCAPSVPFEVKQSLEGLVDRFDDLSQRPEQGCARPIPFTTTGRSRQLDSMLGQFAFETTAEVVLVANESLSRALSQKLAFGCQEVEEGLAFVGLGPGQGEGDGQTLKGADQVHGAAPEEATAAGAVAYSAQPARSERLTFSRERPHSTGVESTTPTSSLHTEVVAGFG